MNNRIIFREKLSELRAAADRSGGILTKEEVRELLRAMPLEEKHFNLICEYLAEQNICVVESREEAEDSASEAPLEDARRSLSVYLDELSALADVTEEEEARLIGQVRAGDASAQARLIEMYLPLICAMAGDYEGDGIPAEDLIQEGNLGLLSAIRTLGGYDSLAACRAHILNCIREAMGQAADSGQDYGKQGANLVSRVNQLNEAVHNLERDLGRRISAEELSAYLEIPLEEIESLLRICGDQIGLA